MQHIYIYFYLRFKSGKQLTIIKLYVRTVWSYKLMFWPTIRLRRKKVEAPNIAWL